ncbi:MAG: apolipoprotein N-acyltransferase [Acidobacteria bacterium]|nr:apolipoprotein N-acyltransferase [Acidobacteriota bacterium]MCL5286766.1 apolipoprotein N-acyltransferase [Acidobacteriota bacterium]
MNLPLRWRLLAACGSGILLPFAFAPHNARLLPCLGLVLLFQPLLGASPRVAAACGLLHGFFFYCLSVRWIYSVMHEHGGLSPISAAGVLVAFVLYLSIFPVMFSLLLAFLSRRSVTLACVAAPFLWVAVEYGRTHAPILGFQWNQLGYSLWYHLGLLQIVTLTGIYGLTFVLAGYNALLTWALAQKSRLALTIWFLCTLAILGSEKIPERFVPQERAARAAVLVQTNFPEAPSYPVDWMEQHAREMDELERLSVDAGKNSDLIIWPEVPAPFYFVDPKFTVRAQKIARDAGTPFLVGVVEWRPGPDKRMLPYNSAVMLDPAGKRVFQYDKIHLVPFGEYVPLRRLLTFASQLTAEVGGYQAGKQYSTGELPDKPAPWEFREPGPPHKFGVFICFEAVFPSLVRQFTVGGAELLINISNDGWYGRSAAPDQHLAMARVRAVENRRWLLRATNNGYTAAIDPYGREVARLDADIRGVLRAPFSFRKDQTLYARWGDWFAWLCVIASLGFIVGARLALSKGAASDASTKG